MASLRQTNLLAPAPRINGATNVFHLVNNPAQKDTFRGARRGPDGKLKSVDLVLFMRLLFMREETHAC